MRLNEEKLELLRQGKVIIYNDKNDESDRLLKNLMFHIGQRIPIGDASFYFFEKGCKNWNASSILSNDHKYIKQHFPAWFFEKELNNKILLLL